MTPSSTGRRVLITAGPTWEPVDAVRFLGNRSSGRMGLALAEAAVAVGCPTTLLLGPTCLRPPEHSHLVTERFQATAELRRLLHRHWPEHDVLIMAAAVADYRPVAPDTSGKIRRGDAQLILELEPTEDLVAEVAELSRPGQLRIGFALEPAERLGESARAKLARKRLDAIVANPLETMDAEDVEASLILADGREVRPGGRMGKPAFARWLLGEVLGLES